VWVQTDGIELVGEAKDATPLGRLSDGRARGREIRDRDDASCRDRGGAELEEITASGGDGVTAHVHGGLLLGAGGSQRGLVAGRANG
jgi:hypothetical protein